MNNEERVIESKQTHVFKSVNEYLWQNTKFVKKTSSA